MRDGVEMDGDKNKNGRIQFLDGLRGVAIVMVVGIHATEYSGLSSETKHLVLACLQIAVSSFFLADGYLFFYQDVHRQSFDYLSYLRRSARRLLVPWLIFSAIYTALRGVFEYLGYLPQKIIVGRTVPEIAMGIYLSSVSSQMYFLLSLFLIRAWTPILRHLSSIPSYGVILIFVVYTLVWNNWNFSDFFLGARAECPPGGCFDPILHALWGLQYYLLGACLYFCHRQLLGRRRAIAAGIIILYVIAKGADVCPAWLEQYFHLLAAYFLMLIAVNSENWLTRIGNMTMGIYILHMPVVLKGVSLIVPAMLGNGNVIINYACITLITVAISIILTKALITVDIGRYVLGNLSDTIPHRK